MAAFVLVHSPLVGPFTWALVADELRQRGYEIAVPELSSSGKSGQPYWKQHADAVAWAVKLLPSHHPIILVGHSGAGLLLPAIREASGRPASAYLFVDAGIPTNGKSRLDLFQDPTAAANFRQAAIDGLLPVWTGEDLREIIPNDKISQRFVAELRPLPLQVYEEPIPVFDGWPDAPCGYLRFTGTNSDAYEEPARQAQREGWAYAELEGGHFHMLVDPQAVTEAIIKMADASLA